MAKSLIRTPCKYCGSEKISLYRMLRIAEGEDSKDYMFVVDYFLCCDNCQHQGGSYKSEDEAIFSWNSV